ncbi:MAG: diaminopimelate epimerase [Candidatus Omnitrophota bacterium]
MSVKMAALNFCKLQASGNDFILLDFLSRKSVNKISFKSLSKELCERRHSVGSDGLLVIEPSINADFKMRIFNSDGSEAEMCGNGARCAAFWAYLKMTKAFSKGKTYRLRFETISGIIDSEVSPLKHQPSKYSILGEVRICMRASSKIKLDLPVNVQGRKFKVNHIVAGVPHLVVFVEGLDKINVAVIGRRLRFDKQFQPEGANVNFVECVGPDTIKIRTYERGVEAETFACGTGSVAAALIAKHKYSNFFLNDSVNVITAGKETLQVYSSSKERLKERVWLKGHVRLLFSAALGRLLN